MFGWERQVTITTNREKRENKIDESEERAEMKSIRCDGQAIRRDRRLYHKETMRSTHTHTHNDQNIQMKINYGPKWISERQFGYGVCVCALMYARVNLIFMFHYAVLIFCGGETAKNDRKRQRWLEKVQLQFRCNAHKTTDLRKSVEPKQETKEMKWNDEIEWKTERSKWEWTKKENKI